MRGREASGGAFDLVLCRSFRVDSSFTFVFMLVIPCFFVVFKRSTHLLSVLHHRSIRVDGGLVGEVCQSGRRGDLSGFSRESDRRHRKVTRKFREI